QASSAGRVNNNRQVGTGGQAENSRGHKQGSNRRSQQRSGSGRVSNKSVRQDRNRNGMQVTRYRGPRKTTHQGPDCIWPSLHNQLQCLAGCRVSL
ncbi:unnamed protein product, partial [Staurois parvus]